MDHAHDPGNLLTLHRLVGLLQHALQPFVLRRPWRDLVLGGERKGLHGALDVAEPVEIGDVFWVAPSEMVSLETPKLIVVVTDARQHWYLAEERLCEVCVFVPNHLIDVQQQRPCFRSQQKRRKTTDRDDRMMKLLKPPKSPQRRER